MNLYTITEAAEYLSMTRQAIFLAIRQKRLKAEKNGKLWFMTKEDIIDYLNAKYVRPNRCKAGEVTIREASELLCLDTQRIYYLVYCNAVKWEKRNGMIFIQRKSLVC